MIFSLSASIAYAVNWKFCCENDEWEMSFDKDSIKRQKDYYLVWFETIYKQGHEPKINVGSYYTPKYKNADVCRAQYAIKYDGSAMQCLYRVYYFGEKMQDYYESFDRHGKINDNAWDTIVPDTIGEDMYKATKPKRFGIF